jgi:hypothetical protein
MKYDNRRFLTGLHLAALMASALAAHGAVILTGNEPSPLIPNPPGTTIFTDTGVAGIETDLNLKNPNRSLGQTFQVDATFTLDAVFIEYQAPAQGYVDGTASLRIFPVADVNAATLTASGSDLLNVPFVLDPTTRAAAFFTSSTTVTSVLKLDLTGVHEVTILANDLIGSPNSGYAILLETADNGANNRALFTWQGSNTGAFTRGRGYVIGTGQTADFAVALTAVPEPTVPRILALGAFYWGVARLRRRSIFR